MSFKKKIKKRLDLCLMTARYGGSPQRKAKYFKFARIAQKAGVVSFRIDRVASEYVDAWYSINDMSPGDKLWYISHGFNPNRKAWYGITKENYRSFVSDFEFYRTSSYVNNPFTGWFDDKLTTYRMLQPFKENQPVHFCYIKNGILLPLDLNGKIAKSAEAIIALAKERPLALKRCVGGHGAGFMKLHYSQERFWLNDKEITPSDLVNMISSLDGYVVTEFVKPHASLRAIIGEDNFTVLRVISIFDAQDGPQVVGIIARIGTAKAGHTQAGHDHFYMNVDMTTGHASDAVYEYSDYDFENILTHPETGASLDEVAIPGISEVMQLVKDVSVHLAAAPYLVFDIVPTDDGPKILEINSHGQPFIVDQYVRVKKNRYFAKLFNASLNR